MLPELLSERGIDFGTLGADLPAIPGRVASSAAVRALTGEEIAAAVGADTSGGVSERLGTQAPGMGSAGVPTWLYVVGVAAVAGGAWWFLRGRKGRTATAGYGSYRSRRRSRRSSR